LGGGDKLDKKKVSLALAIAIIVAFASVAFASITLYYKMPMSATVVKSPSITIYLDNATWINGTDVDWGNFTAGQSKQKSLDIYNTGNVALQITIQNAGVPQDWSLTYTRNGTVVNPLEWLNGTLTLTVASTASLAGYYWDCNIYATS